MNERIRAVVVDDEPLAREGLKDYLEQEPDVEVVAVCSDGIEAVRVIRKLDPDVIFLDIQMPELTGFEVIEAIGLDEMPPVVFVTAYDEFALRAFDACAVDYVLKPIDPERVARAVDRARHFIRSPETADMRQRMEQVLKRLEPRCGYLRKFAVREGGKIRFVDTGEISWIEASGNYIVLHGAKREYRLRSSMASLASKLDPAEFVRIHRSTFVRIDRIREMEPFGQGDYLVVLDSGKSLVSSRSCRDDVRELLKGIRWA